MTRARIVIAGGGPVGLALAAALTGCDVHVIESAPKRVEPWLEEIDARVYAVSPGTRDFLRDLGAWEALDARRVAPVRRMEIFAPRRRRSGRTRRAPGPSSRVASASRATSSWAPTVPPRAFARR
jgi:2-polyprenyl-6-methoxyphenol hydroxylase-like FAD-dependent oxidoreductase